MMIVQHGRMIIASVEKGPLVWPSITEDGVTRLKEYVELTPAEAIQADCDIKAINIILQGLPTEIYALFTLQGTGRPDVAEYYLRFTLLLNDMNIYKMPLEQFQVNTKFLNTLPVELHISPYQSSQFLTPYQHHQYSTPLSSTYPTNEYQSTVHHNVYSQQQSIPQLEYAPTTYQQQQPEFSQSDSSLVVPYSERDDPIGRHTSYVLEQQEKFTPGASGSNTEKTIRLLFAQQGGQALTEEEIAFLADPGLPDVQNSQTVITHNAAYQADDLDAYDSDCDELNSAKLLYADNLSRNGSDALTERLHILSNSFEQGQEKDSLMKTVSELKNKLQLEENRNIEREIELEKKIKQLDNINFKRGQSAQTVRMLTNSKRGYDHSSKQAIGFEKPFCLKKRIVVPDSDETLELSEKSRSKMLLKEQDPLMVVKERTNATASIEARGEEALVLRDIVEHVKANYPHDPLLESAVRYTKVIQDLLSHISRSCPSINNCGPQKTEAIPRKKDKQVRFAETLTLTENTKPASTSNIVANKRVLHSTGVRHSTCASGSQPSGNTVSIVPQPPSSNLKNKVEAHHRNVKTSLNKKNGAVNVKGSAVVQNLKKQDNSDSICVNSNDCMSSDNLCVSNAVNVVKSRAKSKKHTSKKNSWKPTGKVFTQIGYIWRPTGRTFTIVGNECPLTRIPTTNEVPSRKPIVLDSESPKPVVKLVYSRKSRNNTNAESVSKTKSRPNRPLRKSSKIPHKTNLKTPIREKLSYCYDLCGGPMRVASVSGKKYFLVIVDGTISIYWVKCLRSKHEAPVLIIKFFEDDKYDLRKTVDALEQNMELSL
ncbi:hypothetical protein Tco_0725717 [Tanacetum coccineum]|uniref:Uncharacterized protein n=1 Tax=Tanacetum coccineum TaxID=301880 RepID=A0ABQ4YEJ9_9ASTR